jgi:hypothetical protein
MYFCCTICMYQSLSFRTHLHQLLGDFPKQLLGDFPKQRKTQVTMALIHKLEKENTKQVMALEQLNYVQQLIGNILERRLPFGLRYT